MPPWFQVINNDTNPSHYHNFAESVDNSDASQENPSCAISWWKLCHNGFGAWKISMLQKLSEECCQLRVLRIVCQGDCGLQRRSMYEESKPNIVMINMTLTVTYFNCLTSFQNFHKNNYCNSVWILQYKVILFCTPTPHIRISTSLWHQNLSEAGRTHSAFLAEWYPAPADDPQAWAKATSLAPAQRCWVGTRSCHLFVHPLKTPCPISHGHAGWQTPQNWKSRWPKAIDVKIVCQVYYVINLTCVVQVATKWNFSMSSWNKLAPNIVKEECNLLKGFFTAGIIRKFPHRNWELLVGQRPLSNTRLRLMFAKAPWAF